MKVTFVDKIAIFFFYLLSALVEEKQSPNWCSQTLDASFNEKPIFSWKNLVWSKQLENLKKKIFSDDVAIIVYVISIEALSGFSLWFDNVFSNTSRIVIEFF